MNLFKTLVLAFLLAMPVAAHGGQSPLNPDFIEWRNSIKTRQQAEAKKAKPLKGSVFVPGERPSPVNRTHLNGKAIGPKRVVKPLDSTALKSAATRETTAETATVPTESSYDIRDYGWVSPIRDQGDYGTCWAFAALASLESSALKQGWSAQDFSEKHLAWYGYNDIDSTLVAFDNNYPGDSVYDLGGNNEMSAALLTRWTGAVAEADVPYANMGATGTIPPAGAANAAWVSDILYAPGGSEVVGNIKYLVKEYGAVRTSIYWASSFYRASTFSFYNSSTSSSNHAVDIIGWDDNYPASNFNTAPSSNGAWIVRNSWGTDWGNNGYFYISYKDLTIIERGGYAYRVTPVEAGMVQYHYTPLGMTSQYYLDTSTGWTASIFTATGDQQIEKVGIITMDVGDVVTVFVYTGVSASDPTSGTLAYQSTPTAYPTPGSRNLDLPTPIDVAEGQRFSVVVKIETPNPRVYIPCEEPIDYWSSKASASAGQSFYGYSGVTWYDWTTTAADGDICIRAYASPDTDDNGDPALPGRFILLLDD